MTQFSTQARQNNLPLYEKILAMPFNAELAAGTLREDRFRHYIIQDAHYLEGFARALALAAAKADSADQIVRFAEASKTAIIVERALHADYFKKFSVSAADFAASPPTAACDHYVSYLLRIAALEPLPVVLAALLPCFWIYLEAGKNIHARAARPNSYQTWIDTYAGKEFETAVRAVITTTDAVAARASVDTLTAMHAAFTRATKLEWMFWDSAYRLANWPV
jgi:thiaminase/transcriptional activator TenA